jgi:type IV secretion system protein VirB6
VVTAILTVQNYNFYVTQFFFTDLPNTIGAGLHGARTVLQSAQQFDVLADGVFHFEGFALGLSFSLSQIPDRIGIILVAWLTYGALWIDFAMWYMSRIFMALAIAMGPWIVILFLWQITRGFVHKWIGILFGMSMIGLVSSILLRILLVNMAKSLANLEYDPTIPFDVVTNSFLGVCLTFWFGTILMIVIPTVFGVTTGVGAGSAVAFGMGVSAAGTVGGAATKLAAEIGKKLGRYTGSR